MTWFKRSVWRRHLAAHYRDAYVFGADGWALDEWQLRDAQYGPATVDVEIDYSDVFLRGASCCWEMAMATRPDWAGGTATSRAEALDAFNKENEHRRCQTKQPPCS